MQVNFVSTGTEHSQTVFLIHAVGYDLTYWDRQIEALNGIFNVIAFDLPGHGASPRPPDVWSFEGAVVTVAELVETLSPQGVHLVGISFGGMLAQEVVLARPDLVRSLTLIGTASSFSEAARQGMRKRAQATRGGGMAAILQSSLERWFTPETRARRPDIVDRVSKTLLADDPEVHAAIWDMISGFETNDRLEKIACPTLVLVGEADPSTPVSSAKELAQGISGAELVIIPGASHMVTVEAPASVNKEMLSFLNSLRFL